MKKTALLWVGLSFTLFASLSCFIWAIQSVMIEVTPNYSTQDKSTTIYIALMFAVLSLAIAFILTKYLINETRKRKLTNNNNK